MKPIFIAEIKTKSPFGFVSKYSQSILTDTALEYGDWISVHTDPRFGGSFDDIYRLRQETTKPILAKGFHCHDDDIQKALDLGADYVLVVDRIPNFFYVDLSRLLIELNHIDKFQCDLNRLETFKEHHRLFKKELKYVYNSRNLKTGSEKMISDYDVFRKKFNWVCGASNIYAPSDVAARYPNCDAFIVGEHLMSFCDKL